MSKLHSPSNKSWEKDCETMEHFEDLGTLLFGGVAAAIVLAVAFVLIRFRLQDKKEESNKSTRIFTD